MAPTFASAAAQNQNASREGADWSRRPNGATQTFRRPSGPASTMSSSQQQEVSSASQPARYVPPHRNGPQPDFRYSKEQLLDLYKAQQQSMDGSFSDGLSDLYIGGWHPDTANGAGSSGWSRGDQPRENQPGADICWDKDGNVEPLGLIDMDDEERELFAASVNTPLKPPSNAKDTQQSNGLSGRKISISAQSTTSGGYGPLSPTSTRTAGRRRETSESFQFPSNPLSATSGFNREEQRATSPPPSLVRRRTDVKDGNKASEREADSDDKSATNTLGGSLKRTTTGPLNAGFGSTSSPWSNAPQSAGISPMGSFGNFGLGQQSSQSEKRPGIGSGRAESRFKNLLNKESGEDSATKPVERKTSMSSLSRLNENESWRPQPSQEYDSGPLEESEEDLPMANTSVDKSVESQSLQTGSRGFGTPGRSDARDDYGFGAFGMTLDNASGFGQGFFQSRQLGGPEAMSPTDTNPYQSPPQHAVEHLTEELDPDMSDIGSAQLPGLGGFGNESMQNFGGLGGLGALPNLGRPGGIQDLSHDRSQTSSAGANRGFPGLGGIGPLGGVSGAAAWPVSHGGIGTPTRQTSGLNSAFGSGVFSAGMNDLQSPGLAGLGGNSMLSPQISAGGSRLASMFPPAMHEQMRLGEQDQGSERSFPGLSEYGRPGDNSSGRGEPQVAQIEQERSLEQQSRQFGTPSGLTPQTSQQPIGQPLHPSQEQSRPRPPSAQPQSQQSNSSASNQPPPPQQRTMVMPDRMRWIYKDPQGQMQGPWSGLEMHDWYKAGFFSPELLVKKYEDMEYEPLAQLIRRIGNSREPFLVPQIGIPHGAPSNNGPTAWAGSGSAGSGSGSAGAGGAQPPFASSFPSFGTTLTAEQQNALERRKQEEQYLMARQKEHLAQAQIAQRMQHSQMHHGGQAHHGANLMTGQSQLQHHGSSQSLHSQPSFGSMASPTSGPYQSSPSQGPQPQAPGFFDNSFRAPGQGMGLGAAPGGVENLGQIREEEIPGIMDRLDLNNRAGQGQFGAPGQPFGGQQQMQTPSGPEGHERQVQQMLEDRARLQQEQESQDVTQSYSSNEQAATNERLLQFQQLQGKIDARFQPAMGQMSNENRSPTTDGMMGSPTAVTNQQQPQSPELSLTEQVQKAASVQQSPVQQRPGLPQPFPPAPSQSPLPAPAAQRTGRQSVADQLQTEQRDLSETSSVDTPSAVAPWAKDSTEANRGPSLKEIQEMEAKKAAEAEEIATTARRAALQREMEAQAQVPPAPGLPASASWGAGSPSTPTGSNAPAWAKAAKKPVAPTTTKSMAQIQKEEEARKKKISSAVASAQATAMSGVANPAGGKSYANLAGKVGSVTGTAPAAGGAWTTVGAGGKPKTPAAPAVPTPNRSSSSGIVPTAQTAATAVKKPPTRSTTSTGGVNAQDEFRRWAVGELRLDLNKGISAEEFVGNLVALPQDSDMITEAVHGASSTIDSRHFAEEFIRRKKLADKGLIDTTVPPKSASPHSASVDKSGGWSEVAKKGPPKEVSREESNGNFRVVASKKKGAKR